MYEYKVVTLISLVDGQRHHRLAEQLNSLGEDGWNLVHMDGPTHSGGMANKQPIEQRLAFFKRLDHSSHARKVVEETVEAIVADEPSSAAKDLGANGPSNPKEAEELS